LIIKYGGIVVVFVVYDLNQIELYRLLGTIQKSASGYVYIANAIKEYSAVR
jgi:hypothetical protein